MVRVPMTYAIAMGVRRGDEAFQHELDAGVIRKRPEINAILAAIPRAARRSAPRRKGVRPVTPWHAGVTAVLLTAFLALANARTGPCAVNRC